jgi:hypothetical protein
MMDRRSVVRSFGFVAFLIITTFLSAQTRNVLEVTFAAQSLTVRGLTPGGSLVLFGVAREPLINTTPAVPAVVVRAEILTDKDRDGVVRLDLPTNIPAMGMWSAVELSSGRHLLFPSPGFEPRLVSVGADLVRTDSAGDLRKIEWPFSQIDLLVVRPGTGAWRQFASKGSMGDENRSNGFVSLRIDAGNMTPIGNSLAGPGTFRSGDIVAIFDRRDVQYGILEVGK